MLASADSPPGRNPVPAAPPTMTEGTFSVPWSEARTYTPGEPPSRRCASAVPPAASPHTGCRASWSSLSSPRRWLAGRIPPVKTRPSELWPLPALGAGPSHQVGKVWTHSREPGMLLRDRSSRNAGERDSGWVGKDKPVLHTVVSGQRPSTGANFSKDKCS